MKMNSINGITDEMRKHLPFKEQVKYFMRSIIFKIKNAPRTLIITIIFIISLLATGFFTWFVTYELVKPREFKFKSDTSIQQRLQELKASHDYFTKVATTNELINRWLALFVDAAYKQGGTPNANEYDCVTSLINYFRSWGGNVAMEGIEGMDKRSDKLCLLGRLSIRKSFNEVKKTDIIIFNPLNGSRHVGLIIATANGKLIYVDVNAGTMTWGCSWIPFGSDRIQKIYSCSYDYWTGDLMQELNK
jgi:hypothetical protein